MNLKALVTPRYNRMIQRLRLPARPLAPCERGEVLYDVPKAVLAL